MKSTAVFLGIVFGLSFLVSTAMLVTATMKPQWFQMGAKAAPADTSHVAAKKDSLAAATASSPADSSGSAKTSAAPNAAGSTATNPAPVAASPSAAAQTSVTDAKLAAQKNGAADSTQTDTAKTQDVQDLVKLYDAMKPEDAARILAKQNDKEIRTIILHIKKKQAAKILANFNADRAAQILAQ